MPDLSRQLCVAKPRNTPGIPAVWRLDLTKNLSPSLAEHFHHGLLGTITARRIGVAIAVLAALVRLAHFAAIAPTSLARLHVLFESSDMAAFNQWAAGIAAGDVLDREAYRPERVWHADVAPRQSWREWYGLDRSFYKAPGYTYVVAGSRAVFGANLMGPLALLQIAAASVSTFLVFSIGRRLFGQAAGVAAAGLYAVFGPGVHYDVLMLRHAWIVLTLLAVTLALLRLGEQPSLRSAMLLGLGLGAAMLVKVSALSTALACIAVVAWWLRRDRARLARVIGAVALGFAIALVPWLLRNALVEAPLAPRGGECERGRGPVQRRRREPVQLRRGRPELRAGDRARRGGDVVDSGGGAGLPRRTGRGGRLLRPAFGGAADSFRDRRQRQLLLCGASFTATPRAPALLRASAARGDGPLVRPVLDAGAARRRARCGEPADRNHADGPAVALPGAARALSLSARGTGPRAALRLPAGPQPGPGGGTVGTRRCRGGELVRCIAGDRPARRPALDEVPASGVRDRGTLPGRATSLPSKPLGFSRSSPCSATATPFGPRPS